MGQIKRQKSGSFEGKTLIIISAIFVAVIAGAWVSAMSLKQTIAAKNSAVNIDARAPIEVEKIRNVALSKIADSRSFFLLGSKVLFDEQKKEQQNYRDLLAKFQRDFSLPQVPEIVQKLEVLADQEQEVFDQAMKFREQQTESKIVGQFYQSKIVPIRQQINDNLSSIVRIHSSELDNARERAKEAAAGAEAQIPRGMTFFSGLIVLLFAGMVFLVVRMIKQRTRQYAERDRLYEEAKKAYQGRDEVMVAVANDLKDPLESIANAVEGLPGENVEIIKSSLTVAENRIKDILDQAKADTGIMSLRLDQIGINDILSDARFMLQPLAKQKDIRLQIDLANPPILAFFDRERVLRVISNLVGNAIKFSPKHGKVAIRVRSDQQFVHVSVNDSGPGIPEKQIPHLFDRFWQASKTADQGAGVGLAVAKSIVVAHGGTIGVDCLPGNGSTFTFTLPRRRPVGAVLPGPTPTVRPVTRTQGTLAEGPTT
jgi:signal transduction histidine kinase